jgi:Ca2+/Na+ antiporter
MDFLAGYAAFLDYRYWLNPRPVPLGPSLVGGIFAFFGWILMAGVAFRIAAHVLRKKDKLRSGVCRRLSSLLVTTALLGLLFLFFAYEQLPIFGMRLWFLLLFVLFIAWLARIVAYIVKDYPKERSSLLERLNLEKYLPARRK